MYTFADRILDKVTAFLANPENGPRQKIQKTRAERRQNGRFCEDKATLLHYGNNGAKTFRLRQDLRCGTPILAAGSRPKSKFAGLANPEHRTQKRKPVLANPNLSQFDSQTPE
ncbi:hypothetical protein [Mesorhizobium sp.]|uniref:hypothetical protein n=1 Tax=Mesorhizobium sp. TaxID=1871066 RepID=UPI00120D312D|nr:hypothetical protein [Mesorhizobium sp.]TIM82845.1 MAG: hypothetical protein E5Y50_27750 [Mesorhizobium sp.]